MAEQIGINDGWLRDIQKGGATSFDNFSRGQTYILSFKTYTNYPELAGNHAFYFAFGDVDHYVQVVIGLSDTKIALRKYDRQAGTQWSPWSYFQPKS